MKQSVYVRLFHGRKEVGEQLEDWGSEGPVIGPVGLSWTYGTLKLHKLVEGSDNPASVEWDSMEHVEMGGEANDLIQCGGFFYGDMEVWANDDPLVAEAISEGRVISFDEWAEDWNGR